MNPAAICSGVVKNSGLSGTIRKIACQAAKNSTTASAPSIGLRCRCIKLAAMVEDVLAIVSNHDFVFQRVPDFKLEIVELRRDPHLIFARTRQPDVEDLLGSAGT